MASLKQFLTLFDLAEAANYPEISEYLDCIKQSSFELNDWLTQGLQQVLGDDPRLGIMLHPAVVLAVTQFAVARHTQIKQSTLEPITLPSFSSLKEMEAVRLNEPHHKLLSQLINPDFDFSQLNAVDWGEHDGTNYTAVTHPAPISTQSSAVTQVTYGMPVLKRLAFSLISRGQVKFLRKLPALPQAKRHAVLREQWFASLDKTGRSHDELALALYVVLTAPCYMAEYAAQALVNARYFNQKLNALATGPEMIRKPEIAALIADVKYTEKPIFGIQHGGNAGQIDPRWNEIAEECFVSHFGTWGYTIAEHDEVMPNLKLSTVFSKPLSLVSMPSNDKVLVVVQYISNQIQHGFHSPSFTRQTGSVKSALKMIGDACPGYKIHIRSHPLNNKQDLIDNLDLAQYSNIEFVEGSRGTIAEDAKHYQAVLFTTPSGTGHSECLDAGIPFLVVCERNDVWLRPQNQDVYQQLLDSKIWVTSTDQLSEHVAKAFLPSDTSTSSYQTFYQRFVGVSSGYLSRWIAAFAKIQTK
ncbi:hypothetical protein [Echinimonas agarilytica]|uniref:Uncharacterized protein n=1 Tax=Echinimonas agarilytica TaxID=1215918 RepID=A0AA42B6D9_9GAMM|nr:hypothetical protein [Echinimonas agarilytica]MCM2678685.1 hypothetical protein [Echinimonas agarilytica]